MAPARNPQAEEDWSSWRQAMEYGRRWKNNVKAAQGHHDLQATKRSDWHEWHRQVLYLYRAVA